MYFFFTYGRSPNKRRSRLSASSEYAKKRQSYKGELAPTLIFINVNQKSLRRRSLLPISRRASQTLNISLM